VERSALLVSAPVDWADGRPRFNPEPNVYRARFQFTTAHEDFPLTSENRLYRVSPPSAPGDHASLGLYLAKSKHGTYIFNPDGHEVIIRELRISVLVATAFTDILIFVEDILGGGQFSRARLITLGVLLIGTTIVEHCFTESFSSTASGAIVPNETLNIGEHRRLRRARRRPRQAGRPAAGRSPGHPGLRPHLDGDQGVLAGRALHRLPRPVHHAG
jgi:hypothetical protein